MRTVWILWHKFDLSEDESSEVLVGVYSSEEKADQARGRALLKPGFRDHADGFEVMEAPVDEDQWTEGFMVDEAGDLVG